MNIDIHIFICKYVFKYFKYVCVYTLDKYVRIHTVCIFIFN